MWRLVRNVRALFGRSIRFVRILFSILHIDLRNFFTLENPNARFSRVIDIHNSRFYRLHHEDDGFFFGKTNQNPPEPPKRKSRLMNNSHARMINIRLVSPTRISHAQNNKKPL